jgi:hypothetical protein
MYMILGKILWVWCWVEMYAFWCKIGFERILLV